MTFNSRNSNYEKAKQMSELTIKKLKNLAREDTKLPFPLKELVVTK